MSQLTNYIQKELDKGFAKDLITKKLLQAGYAQEEITESFKSLKTGEPLLKRKFVDTIHEDAKVIRSKWLFPILGVLLLVVFGYLIFHYVEMPSGTECDNISDIEEKDICYLELATSGEKVCEKITNNVFKTACEQKIWSLRDCTYEMLIDKDPETCLLNKAIETKDTRYCTMQEEHTDCLLMLANSTNDPSLCQGDSFCLALFAIEKKNPEVCETIFFSHEECYDTYAAETGDTSICDEGGLLCGYPYNGTTGEKKTFIESKLFLLSTEIPDGNDLSEKDEYLISFAKQTKELAFCEYIDNQLVQEDCYAKTNN
jgi:hypothetical protein